ncbi:MAG: YbbR-like domain-containing protein [Saprospiraceae bacterium]|nr:YbbR-like domain-containing protein [Saprospiraceae bacterium]
MNLPNHKKKSLIHSDRAVLLLCIGISLVFWVGLKLSKNYIAQLIYKINYTLPSGKTFSSKPADIVEIKVKAKGWQLLKNSFNNKQNIIDYHLDDKGEQILVERTIRNAIHADLAYNIDIVEIIIPDKAIALEKMDQKKIPVKLITKSDIGMGFLISSKKTKIYPDSITITGPISLVTPINEWKTQVLTLKRYPKSYSTKIKLTDSPHLEVRPDVNKVNVQLDIEQVTEKTLQLPMSIVRFASNNNSKSNELIFLPSTITVKAVVPMDDYDMINANDFSVLPANPFINSTTYETSMPLNVSTKNPAIQKFWYYPQSVKYFVKL